MKLNIFNLAKVKSAEIDVDGITVIAGSNNTGKSTVGKVVYSLFNALNDMESKILMQRISSLRTLCRRSIRNALSHGNVLGELSRSTGSLTVSMGRLMASEIMNEAQDVGCPSFSTIRRIVNDTLEKNKINFAPDEVDEIINEIYVGTQEILQLPEKAIAQALVSRYFENVFNKQINALKDGGTAAIELELKKRSIRIEFKNHKCSSLASDIAILHKAIYIDNPFILDLLDEEDYRVSDNPLIELLGSKYDDAAEEEQLIESVLAEEKMDSIFEMLSSVVNGRILIQNGEYFLKDDNSDQPISVKNLSSGLKSFVLIKMLVESGVIRNNDVLVLDEPEIHLHPEWQIVYAELIVLLQKQLNLSVIVTTHSPYFLDAINLFSIKHKVENKTNYYLSKIVNSQTEFQKVSECIDAIYKEMASPIDILETLRFELTEE